MFLSVAGWSAVLEIGICISTFVSSTNYATQFRTRLLAVYFWWWDKFKALRYDYIV